MSPHRYTTQVACTIVAALAFASLGASDAHAGCLDWLFGRNTAYSAYYPYQTGISPTGMTVGQTGVVAAQRPAYGATTQPGYGAVTQPGYGAGIQPGYATMGTLAPVQSYNNPSVYTGMPTVSSNQGSYRLPLPGSTLPGSTLPQSTLSAQRVPIAQTLRGTAALNPILPPSSYVANYPSSVAPVAYAASPSTTVLPLASTQPRPFGSGLRRFFNSLLGRNTNYVTSYYRAPITYYRPLSTVDPVSGTTVTVQQPCSSYVQQLQRIPYNSFLPLGQSTVLPTQVTPGGCPSSLGLATSLPPTSTPGTFAPPAGAIGQVGGMAYPGAPSGITTIPSIIPDASTPGASFPNTAPLTGQSAMGGSDADPADLQNIPKPEIEAQRPSNSDPLSSDPLSSDPLSSDPHQPLNAPSSYYEDMLKSELDRFRYNESPPVEGSSEPQEKQPAVELYPPVTGIRPTDPRRNQRLTTSTPPSLLSETRSPALANQPHLTSQEANHHRYSTMRPIGILGEDEAQVPQFTRPDNTVSEPAERPSGVLDPPPLPAPSRGSSDPSALFRNREYTTSAPVTPSYRVSVPVREATTRQSTIRRVAAWEEQPKSTTRQTTVDTAMPKRDGGGWIPLP